MLDIRFRPLARWIGTKTPAYKRRPPAFSAKHLTTLNTLEREFRHLKAKNGTIEGGFTFAQIRNDGWPYKDARPSEPGIILSFDSKHGPLALPCDHFRDWEQNLRAIALHLEHLRLATLYGVGEGGEQYSGWKALPPPGGENSLDGFAQYIIDQSKLTGYTPAVIMGDYDKFRLLYRTAAMHVHPDKVNDTHLWNKLQQAEQILEQHFKGELYR